MIRTIAAVPLLLSVVFYALVALTERRVLRKMGMRAES